MLGKQKILFIASVLAPDVRQQIIALRGQGELTLVALGAIHVASFLVRLVDVVDMVFGTQIRTKMDNYLVIEVPTEHLHSVMWPRLRERLWKRSPADGRLLTSGDRMGFALDAVASKLVRQSTTLIYAREDAAEQTFLKGQSFQIPRIYDLPTPHHATVKRLMESELLEFPGAAPARSTQIEWNEQRTSRKTRELKLASHIVVASTITEQSVTDLGIPQHHVTRIPYGCDPTRIDLLRLEERKPIVLYVGSVSLRKGIPRLLRVWKKLNAAKTHTLRLVGAMCLERKFLQEYAHDFEHIPAVPRSQLPKHYLAASFFVFPTVADGYGLVLNEALSCGLPVLASSNNGAPGFIIHERQGLIYKHGDDDQFATYLDRLLATPKVVREMGIEAAALSRSWTWKEYNRTFNEAICQHLQSHEGS